MLMTRIRDLLFDGIGYVLILCSPFVVGFFVAVESESELGATFPFNFIIAAVLEAAGIMSMHLISRVMDWNRRHETQAPLGWAVVGALAYLGIALGIIVLLSGWPPTRHTAVKGSFVLLTLVGYMVFALYHQQVHIEQGEQTEHIADRDDERWKYETNNEYKLERLRIQTGHSARGAVGTPLARRGTYQDYLALLARSNGNGDLTAAEIVAKLNIPRRTAYNWISKHNSTNGG